MKSLLFVLSLAMFSACSSDDPSNFTATTSGGNGTGNLGGQFNQGGEQNASGGATTGGSAGTANCEFWPQQQLFTWVGAFFYGPDPGPCSVSTTVPETLNIFTYDASNRPTGFASSDGSEQATFVFDAEGRLATETTTDAQGTDNTFQYHYASGSAGYTQTSRGGSIFTWEYTLDARGYPQSIQNLNPPVTAPYPTAYRFEYAGCRILSRVAYNVDGSLNTDQTTQYTYDADGRVVELRSPSNTITFDYSCW